MALRFHWLQECNGRPGWINQACRFYSFIIDKLISMAKGDRGSVSWSTNPMAFPPLGRCSPLALILLGWWRPSQISTGEWHRFRDIRSRLCLYHPTAIGTHRLWIAWEFISVGWEDLIVKIEPVIESNRSAHRSLKWLGGARGQLCAPAKYRCDKHTPRNSRHEFRDHFDSIQCHAHFLGIKSLDRCVYGEPCLWKYHNQRENK